MIVFREVFVAMMCISKNIAVEMHQYAMKWVLVALRMFSVKMQHTHPAIVLVVNGIMVLNVHKFLVVDVWVMMIVRTTKNVVLKVYVLWVVQPPVVLV